VGKIEGLEAQETIEAEIVVAIEGVVETSVAAIALQEVELEDQARELAEAREINWLGNFY
jgi:hypothetical protein